MRKKPDILLLLVVLVVSGVVLSNFIIIKNDNRASNLSLLDARYAQLQQSNSPGPQADTSEGSQFKSREVVRIDWSKQQIQ